MIFSRYVTLKFRPRLFLNPNLQSETAGLEIPEIELVLTHGTLGGRFTTLEGILNQVYEELSEKVFAGDSSVGSEKKSYETFLAGLKSVRPAIVAPARSRPSPL